MNNLVKSALLAPILTFMPMLGALAGSHAQDMDKAYHKQLRDSQLMIGQISLALIILDHGGLDAAATDVDAALRLAQTLEKSAPEFKSKDSMLFGKLTHEEEGSTKLYFIPVAHDDFMVHSFDRPEGKGEKVRETDARMIHAHVLLDVRKAVKGLTDAKAALQKADAKAAERALNGILSATVTNEIAASDPLHVAHDNLVLADNLLREKRYDATRFALKYARNGLGDYTKNVHDFARKQHVEQLQKNIDTLSDQLSQQDPSVLQKAAVMVSGWASDVKKWFAHPTP